MRTVIAVIASAVIVCAGVASGAEKAPRKHAPLQVVKTAQQAPSDQSAATERCQEEPSLHQFYPEELSKCQVTTLGKGKSVAATSANLKGKGKHAGAVATPASLVSPIAPAAITLAGGSASSVIKPTAGASMTIQQMVEDAQAKAAAHYKVPPHILTAIKRVESRGHPYAIGVNLGKDKNGKVQSYPIYPKTYEEAVRHLNSLKTDNVDIGPWQVNFKHIGRHHGVTKVDLLNPYISGALAAWKLATEIQASGYTWNAVGSYHNRSDINRKAWYVGHVKKELRRAGYHVE